MIVSEEVGMPPSSLKEKKHDMTKIMLLKIDKRDLEYMRATDYLIREHETIRSMMGELEGICRGLKEMEEVPWDRLEGILQCFERFVDRIHHGKEEGILIPALIEHGFPLRGGPMCGYFKDLMMMREDIECRIREVEQRLGAPIPIPGEERKISPGLLDGNIPVIEEHRLGRKLVAAMRYCLSDPFLWKGSGPGSFVDFAQDYLALLDEHIEKENRCLFPMADDTLSPAEQVRMIQDFEAFDRTFLAFSGRRSHEQAF